MSESRAVWERRLVKCMTLVIRQMDVALLTFSLASVIVDLRCPREWSPPNIYCIRPYLQQGRHQIFAICIKLKHGRVSFVSSKIRGFLRTCQGQKRDGKSHRRVSAHNPYYSIFGFSRADLLLVVFQGISSFIWPQERNQIIAQPQAPRACLQPLKSSYIMIHQAAARHDPCSLY